MFFSDRDVFLFPSSLSKSNENMSSGEDKRKNNLKIKQMKEIIEVEAIGERVETPERKAPGGCSSSFVQQ